MGDVILQLDGIAKRFDETDALRGISLDVERGEFITFLGPSGCGKTTMLRIISGLEHPDRGRVILQGQDVTDTEPNQRNVHTVFQNYALFPHMNVAAHIGYSLKLQGVKKQEIRERVEAMLELVQLPGFAKRTPQKLSGGQRQRVAIARALIDNPDLLLLDEPLGALDLQLRRQMQTELKRLQKRLGITFLYITHDQEEAMNMSDRIVVMNEGTFEQIGTPAEIYERPATSFAAQFIGTANIFHGRVEQLQGDAAQILTDEQMILAERAEGLAPQEPVTVAVRGEKIRLHRQPQPGFTLAGVVREHHYSGGILRMIIGVPGSGGEQEVVASHQGMESAFQVGDAVYLDWEPAAGILVDRKGARRNGEKA